MPRYMSFVDNEDGTTTITSNAMGEDVTLVISMGFDDIAGLMGGQRPEVVDMITDSMTLVPNDIGEGL